MPYNPKENNISLVKFESMLKTNSVYFFDSMEFEEIIQHYLDSGKNSLAKKAINLGLRQHPNSIMLKLLNAELLIFNDNLEEASKLLKELQAIEPTNDEIYVQQASILSKRDDHLGAIDCLKVALSFTDDEVDVYSIIGMEYMYLDNFDEALSCFSKCLEEDVEDYSSLYNVIYCFDMQSKHEEAIAFLIKHIDVDPYSEVAWHQLGRQHFILEQFEEALRAFDYAVLIDDLFVGAYLEKAKTLEQLGLFELAIENYKTTVELDDPTSFAFVRIGECYEKLNKSTQAIQFYKKAVHEDPLLDKGWTAITELYCKRKNYGKALYHINKALDIDDQNPIYWRKFAEINLKLNQFEEAVEGFENCIILQDFELVIWIGLSDVLCFIGEYEDALEYLLKAKTLFKNFAEIDYRLACLYFKVKNYKKGTLHLTKALKIDFEYHSIIKEIFPEVYQMTIVQDVIDNFN